MTSAERPDLLTEDWQALNNAEWLDAGVVSDESGVVCEIVPDRPEDVDAAHHTTQMMQIMWYDADKDDGSLTEFAKQTERALTSQIIYGQAWQAHRPDLGPGMCPDLWAGPYAAKMECTEVKRMSYAAPHKAAEAE